MAGPFNITQVDAPGLLQMYDQRQRQGIEDMYRQRLYERQAKMDARTDDEYSRKEKARAAIAAGAKPEEVIAADPELGFSYATHSAAIAKDHREELGKRAHAVGTAAMFVSRLPAAEQPAAWDQAVDQLVGQGYTDLAPYKGHYDPKALPGLIAASEEASKAYLEGSDKDRTYAETVRAHRAAEATAAGNLAVARGNLGVRRDAVAAVKANPAGASTSDLLGIAGLGD